MTALAVGPALVAALWLGYYFGRRADTKTPTWKQRTSRTALGRRAITLGALLLARRLRRRYLTIARQLLR